MKLDSEKLLIFNTGIGIKKDEINYIQQRFKRANKSEGGFGIGLDIVGQVIERYEFKLKIESTYNEYTEVIVIWKK